MRKAKANSSPSTLPWRRILVPIDFSSRSLRALEVAVPLSCDNRARLFLLTVIEPSAYAAGFEGVVLVPSGATLAQEARVKLPKLARKHVPASVPVSCLVLQGKPFDVITRIAKERRIDLIVLTTHGYTGLNRLMLGSTAERVVRHAHCPVFVVR